MPSSSDRWRCFPLHVAGALWLVLMQACVAGTVLVISRAVGGWLSPAAKAWLLASSLLFFPLFQALYFIQVIPLLCLLLALTAAAYSSGSETRAGAILGFAAALRVSPLLQAPALLVSRAQLRRPSGLLAMGATGGALLLGMFLVTSRTYEYFTRVTPILARGGAELDNQSPNGLLLRAEALLHRPLPVDALQLAALTTILVMALTWWLSRGDAGPRRKALVFAAFLSAAPLASSLTEPYHLTTELIVIALAAASLPIGSLQWWLALLSYPLLWIDGHLTNPIAIALNLAAPTGWRILPFLLITATNLFGAVLLWLACLVALHRTRGKAVSA